MRGLTVRDVMTRDVITVSRDTPFKELAELLDTQRAPAIIVIDDHDGSPVGVVSEADLLPKQGYPDRRPHRRRWFRRERRLLAKSAGGTAAELMSVPPIMIDGGASLAAAARLMVQHTVRQLPVVEPDGGLAGIVSRANLITAFLRSDAEIRTDVIEQVFGPDVVAAPGSVTVQVNEGVVRLKGTVGLRSQVELVDDAICHIDGVVRVVNELGYRHDDTIRYTSRVPDIAPNYGFGPR